MLEFIRSSYFDSLLEALDLGVVILNSARTPYAANSAAARILGAERNDLLDGAALDTIIGRLQNPEEVEAMILRAMVGENSPEAMLMDYAHPERGLAHLRISATVLAEAGKIFGILIQLSDLTELVNLHEKETRILEEQSRIQQKHIASLNQLSEAVAHQIRNPAMAIGGLAGYLLKKRGDDDLLREHLVKITGGAERLMTVVEAVADYNQPLVKAEEWFDWAALAAGLPDKLAATARDLGLRVDWDIQRDPCRVYSDPALVGRAMLEVGANALEAMAPGKGAVEVRLSGGNNGAHLELSDTGRGLEPSVQPFLFDPFFTTKAVGVGLGLCRARRCLEEVGGSIILEPGRTVGARAVLSLPRREG